MRLKASPAALIAALVEANAAAPATARQKGGDLVWLLADEGGARLRWGEWGRDSRPAGETAVPDVRVAEGGALPLLPTRALRTKLAKAFRGAGGTAEIRDGEIACGGVSERLAVRGRIAEAAPPNGPPPRPGQVLRFDAGDFAAAIPAVAPFISKNEFRPVLRRVEVTYLWGVCRLAATDLYRLGVARLEVSGHDLPLPFARTVPGALFRALGEVAGVSSGEAELRWGAIGGPKEGSAGATRLWTKDGAETASAGGGVVFPDWRSFYGKDHPPRGATLFDPRSMAKEILAYVSEYPEEKDLPVILHLTEEGKVEAELHSRSRSYERVAVGTAKVAVPYNAAFGVSKISEALRSAPEKTGRVRASYAPGENGEAAKGPLYLESGFWRRLVMAYRV